MPQVAEEQEEVEANGGDANGQQNGTTSEENHETSAVTSEETHETLAASEVPNAIPEGAPLVTAAAGE